MTSSYKLSTIVYPSACVAKAITAYGHLCEFRVVERSERDCLLEVEFTPDRKQFHEELGHEFLNYLLDLSLEHHLRSMHVTLNQ
jgi:hypothetical protein